MFFVFAFGWNWYLRHWHWVVGIGALVLVFALRCLSSGYLIFGICSVGPVLVIWVFVFVGTCIFAFVFCICTLGCWHLCVWADVCIGFGVGVCICVRGIDIGVIACGVCVFFVLVFVFGVF